jgi:iron complex outermembrane receptor protein
VNGVPFEVGTFSNNSRVAGVLGIPKLKQETSINYSVGFTAQPTNNFTFSIDGYIIKVDDRVVLTGQFQGNANAAPGTSDREIFDLLSNVGANRAQFFTNAINTTTRGIDIIATYTWAIGEGKLDASVAANFNETTVDQINVASSLLAGRESTYFDRTNTAVVETGNPRSKINVTLNYKVGKFGAMLRSVRFGEVTTNNNAIVPTLNSFTGELESQDQTFSAKWITDFSISYQLFNNLSLQVGANNIFDVYPDEHTHSANNSFGRFRYSRQATQFGFNGAFYFARASVKF